MLERDIEKAVKEYARSKNWIARKWVSPGHAFVPDCILLNYIPPEHRAIVRKYVKFAEFKQTGKKPTPGQEREHHKLRSHGYDVWVVDSTELGRAVVDRADS